ncbi:MAG: RtcB family protein [Chloroflexi bacterium]|nr:RtcB family protein [Chloroflexota bacterium]
MSTEWDKVLRRIDEHRWEIPQDYKPGMRVPGIVFADEEMLASITRDQSLEQVVNVATLPGIMVASYAMPDIHWGYGFPVGGVAATRVEDGVVSPGGVGFDINCGVRLLRTDLTEKEVLPKLERLVDTLYTRVPSGVGASGVIRLGSGEMEEVLARGAEWAVERGFGDAEDLKVTEEGGCIGNANPSKVGERPRKRGGPQLGTLGSGNHFLEVQKVDEIFDEAVARALGIRQKGQVTVLVHCGSRGLGHQICDDYLKVMVTAVQRYGIELPDRQLACVPVRSPEGQGYLGAMNCGANFAWANRQCIAHWVRESFSEVFGVGWRELGIRQVYDVCHNVAKLEEHTVEGKRVQLCVHRKGATRAFPKGHPGVPEAYQEIGQPILIPGDMGRYSYLAVAQPRAMEVSFGSTCHGAGRAESRSAAKRILKGQDIRQQLAQEGIVVRAHGGWASLAEEASIAYKDVAKVVEVAEGAGLSKKVARMRPLGVVKG